MQGNAPPAKGKAAAKKRAIVAGLTGLTAAALLAAPESADAAQELAQLADGRPLLFLGLFAPVLGWVAFNIGAPFFRQLDAMQGNAPPAKGKAAAKKRAAVAGLAGLSASALLAAPEAAQAAELMQLADGRACPPLSCDADMPLTRFIDAQARCCSWASSRLCWAGSPSTSARRSSASWMRCRATHPLPRARLRPRSAKPRDMRCCRACARRLVIRPNSSISRSRGLALPRHALLRRIHSCTHVTRRDAALRERAQHGRHVQRPVARRSSVLSLLSQALGGRMHRRKER